jgi:hypothetical protein
MAGLFEKADQILKDAKSVKKYNLTAARILFAPAILF